MASCNHNICPPSACLLTNAIKDYKKARSGIQDASLKPFLKIIEALQLEISCKSSGTSSGVYKAFPCDNPTSVWTFNHNLDSAVVVVQAYDDDFNQIIP